MTTHPSVHPAREPLAHDGKSGALLERTTDAGRHLVVKHFDRDTDWIARATGELRSRHLLLWRSGLLDRLPGCLDHATVACREDGTGRAELVLRDVTACLVPTDSVLPLALHRRFLAHMAALHARFFGTVDDIGLLSLSNRYLTLSPRTAARELANGGDHPIPTRLIPEGWQVLPQRAPRAGPVALALADDLGPLLAGLARTPWTLLHGDWKVPNLGVGTDGRTILLDWGLAGWGPPGADLAWYLAINDQLLPESREATVEAYRQALAGHGIDTDGWWDRQLALCLVGAFVLLGWDMARSGSPGLGWWDERVGEAARLLR